MIGEKSLIIFEVKTKKQIYNKSLPVIDVDGLKNTYGTTESEAEYINDVHSDARGVSMIEPASGEDGSSVEGTVKKTA